MTLPIIKEQQLTYHNPFWHNSFPDPFILKVRGRYYAYATEHENYPGADTQVFPILTSTDLVQWHDVGKAMPALGQQYSRYWAPEVTVQNDQFLLYYAVHTSEFVGSIRVAVADHPTGPFVDSGYDLTSAFVPWAIDPHVFRDVDGQWYLFMTIEYWDEQNGFVGSGNAVARMVDPFTLASPLTRVTAPGHAWQLFEAKRQERGGVDWYTVEGPSVVKHRGHYYEMFSGGCYYRDNYAVSYATSATPMGQHAMRDTSWHDCEGAGGSEFLLRGDENHMISPGHNSLVLGPNNAAMYLVYHAWQNDRIERRPCLDRLFWHGDIPWTAAPTHMPQLMPTQPRFRDLFESTVLHPSWHLLGGSWHLSQGEVIQKDEFLKHAMLRSQEPLGSTWLLEINLRYVVGDGSYGVLLESDDTSIQVVLTPALSRLAIQTPKETEPIQVMPLPNNLLLKAWHQLMISCCGSILRVQIDGQQTMEAIVESQDSRGLALRSFSLLTERCSAAFSAISLTDHFQDDFLDDRQTSSLLGWHEEREDNLFLSKWQIRNDALEQLSTVQGTHILLKGAALQSYEFGTTLRLYQAHERELSAHGLVIWCSEEDKLLVLLQHYQAHWLVKIEGYGSFTGMNASIELPETFNPSAWHTLRVQCLDEQLTIFLDGPEVFVTPFTSRSETMGLVTRNASAAFTSVWLTGLLTAQAVVSQ